MQCKKIKINNNLQTIQEDIVQQLDKINQNTQYCCEFYKKYEKAISYQQKIINNITQFGGNTQNNETNDIVESQDIHQEDNKLIMQSSIEVGGEISRDRSSSDQNHSVFQSKLNNFQNNNTFKKQSGIIEGQEAILQQKIEQLEKSQKTDQQTIQNLKSIIKDKDSKINKLQQNLQQTEESLVNANCEICELKEIQLINAKNITELSEENKKLIDQVQEEKRNNDEMVSRIIEEKQKMIEKFQQLQQQEDEFLLQKSMFEEREKHFQGQKQQFHQNVKQSGLQDQMPKQAPTMSKDQTEFVASGQTLPPTENLKRFKKFHKAEIYSIVTSNSGNLVATCGGDRKIKLLDAQKQQIIGEGFTGTRAQQVFTDITFSPCDSTILAGSTDNLLQLFSCRYQKKIGEYVGHSQKINSVCFISERNVFASSSDDKTVKLWDASKKNVLKNIHPGSTCKALAAFVSEPHFVTGHTDGSVKVYSASEAKVIYNIPNVFDDQITNLKVSSSGNYVAASSMDGDYIKFLDIRKQNKIVYELGDKNYHNGHENNKFCFGPSDEWIIGGSGSGGTLHFWDIQTNQKRDQYIDKTQHEGTIICCSYSQGAGILYTGDSHGNFFLWN